MCNSNPSMSRFPAKTGDTWLLKGAPMKVCTTEASYFETNGDPSVQYVVLQDKEGGHHLITRKAFLDKAKREEPIVELFITPRQILDAKPCEGGIQALASCIGMATEGASVVTALRSLYENDRIDSAYKVSELHTWYMAVYGAYPDDRYLLFLAKALKLVPESSSGPDRATLKRLLGIKA